MKTYIRSQVELLIVAVIFAIVAVQPRVVDFFAGRPGPDVRLLTAANAHDDAGVRQALADGAALEFRDDSGETALIAAARTGDTAIVITLLDAGSDINANDGHGRDAMSYAELFGQETVERVLTEHGARPPRPQLASQPQDGDCARSMAPSQQLPLS